MQKETKESNKTALKLQHQQFLTAYIETGNAGKAAIAAGYSEKGARVQGARLLTNPAIQEELKRVTEKAAEKTQLSTEWVLGNLKNVAERCMQATPVLEKIKGQWVETGEFRFDSAGANKALELIGKNLQMWNDVGSKENPLHTFDNLTEEQLNQRIATVMEKLNKLEKGE